MHCQIELSFLHQHIAGMSQKGVSHPSNGEVSQVARGTWGMSLVDMNAGCCVFDKFFYQWPLRLCFAFLNELPTGCACEE